MQDECGQTASTNRGSPDAIYRCAAIDTIYLHCLYIYTVQKGMSRALPQPPLSSLTLPELIAQAGFPESITDRTPKEWFDRARHEADLAVLAERKGKKEEVFVAYTRCCNAYTNVKMHPDFKEVRKGDAHWTQRVKDFSEVSYFGDRAE